MRDSAHDTVNGLLGDYCGYLREAAFLLAALAAAPVEERAEDFEALIGTYDESRATHHTLAHELARYPAEAPQAWVTDSRQLSSAVHEVFESLVGTGKVLVAWEDASLPGEVLDQCRLVDSVSTALAKAWQEHHDPAAAERHLWSARLGVAAVERAVHPQAATL